jgi:hypothetical protein
MATIIAIATILVTLGGYLDFLLGEIGNRKIRDRLINFYIGVEEGDWSALYRRPASNLLRFARDLLGQRIVSVKFAVRTIFLSVIVTATMLASYLAIVYLQAVWRETPDCPAPPLLMAAVEVPVYLRHVLLETFIVNATFDLVTWPVTIHCLRIISVTQQNLAPFVIVLFTVAFAFLTLHLLHSVYLPISLAQGPREYGISFRPNSYFQFFSNGFLTPVQDIFHLSSFIGVGCYLPPAKPFSISAIALTQYAALEALIPVVLFMVVCLLGSVAYLTRHFTRKPVALVADRLAASKNVCVTVASLLSGLIAVFRILVGPKI